MKAREVKSQNQEGATGSFISESLDGEAQSTERAKARILIAAIAARQRVADFSIPSKESRESSQSPWFNQENGGPPSGESASNNANSAPGAEFLDASTTGRTGPVSLLLKWLAVGIGWVFSYLVLAYWVAGSFSGPLLPVINMGLGPLIVLIIMLWMILPKNPLIYIWRGKRTPIKPNQ